MSRDVLPCMIFACLLCHPGKAAGNSPPPRAEDAEALGDPARDYALALAHVEDAGRAHDEDRPGAKEQLAAALAALAVHGQSLSRDRVGREAYLGGQMKLSRAYLNDQEQSSAEAVMDDAIRGTLDAPIDASRYGTDTGELYAQRREYLEARGRGELVVNCYEKCRIVIGYTAVGESEKQLYLGTYRVFVESEVEDSRRLDVTLDFDHAGQSEFIEFGAPDTEMSLDVGEPEGYYDWEDAQRLRRSRLRLADGLKYSGNGVLILGGTLALTAIGSLAVRGATKYFLDVTVDDPSTQATPTVRTVYSNSGLVAFSALLSVAVVVPIGVALRVTGPRFDPASKTRRTKLDLSRAPFEIRF